MRYAALVELSRDAMGTVRDGKVVSANPAATELGLSTGIALLPVVDPDYASAFLEAIATDAVTMVRVIGLKATWLEWHFDTQDDDLLFIARDVTAIHDTEEQLDVYMMQLRRHSEEMEQFAYAAAHDLQEPLRTISNYAAFLEEDYGTVLPDEAKENLHFIATSAKHCKELARALLQFSLLGKERHFRWVQVSDILQDVVVARTTSITETKATILCGDLPEVWCDPGLLAAVFSNLLSNALKFSTPGVQVSFTAKSLETAWEFAVCDSGSGFDMKYAAQLFQVFRRLDRSRPGVGIGLATCRKAVQFHGGEIWAESEVGSGSTFSFTVEKPRHEVPLAGGGSRPGHQGGTSRPPEPRDTPRARGHVGWRPGFIVLAEQGRLRRRETPGSNSSGSQSPEDDGLRSPCRCEGKRGDQ